MKAQKIFLFALGAFSFFLFTLGCGSLRKNGKKIEPLFYAVTEVKPLNGGKASGTVWFAEGFGKLKIQIELSGLDPSTKHGIHIHEFGDCLTADGTSAGGHYNPTHHEHAGPSDELRHLGDLGNIQADSKGKGSLTLEIPGLSINSEIGPVLGRSFIVHRNPDDLLSQPAGGAGVRIACGVIGASSHGKPESKK